VQNVEPNAEIGQKGAFCKGLKLHQDRCICLPFPPLGNQRNQTMAKSYSGLGSFSKYPISS